MKISVSTVFFGSARFMQKLTDIWGRPTVVSRKHKNKLQTRDFPISLRRPVPGTDNNKDKIALNAYLSKLCLLYRSKGIQKLLHIDHKVIRYMYWLFLMKWITMKYPYELRSIFRPILLQYFEICVRIVKPLLLEHIFGKISFLII